MKQKHLQVEKDNQLFKEICTKINQELVFDKSEKTKIAVFLVIKFLVYFSLMVVVYSLLFIVQNPILFLICFVSFGFVSLLFAFNFSHDFSHNTVFKSKKLNNFCFTAIYTLVGAHAAAWKKRHVHSHHFAPNVEGYDSDLEISRLIRVTPESKWYSFHRFQYIYASFAYTTYSLFWIFVKDFVILFSKDWNKGFSYHFVFWYQKVFYLTYILVLPLLFSSFSGQNYLLVFTGFLLMHSCQSLFLLFTFFMTHHVETTHYPTTDKDGFINSSWLMNQIKSSNDMHPFSEPANFIFGGFNNHIAHHLFPNIHHIHYPRLNRILYKILEENGIYPNKTSYFGGIISHLRLLKSRGK
ncbi:fatty acid desaturase family protein [Bernardetia sp. OM2101]|uniref:fatty acid desaturase family protein n=1 Tax=Bernardetia sp. OM2101 TaxID=3344876 RepID=UPI0035CFA922